MHRFVLRLGRQQSIGPARLGTIWRDVCGSRLGNVCRLGDADTKSGVSYLLMMPSDTLLPEIEQRMRLALIAEGLSVRMSRTS